MEEVNELLEEAKNFEEMQTEERLRKEQEENDRKGFLIDLKNALKDPSARKVLLHYLFNTGVFSFGMNSDKDLILANTVLSDYGKKRLNEIYEADEVEYKNLMAELQEMFLGSKGGRHK